MNIGYIRSSTTLQENTIENQAEQINTYSKLYKLDVDKTFTDFGLSAKNVDRKGFDEMMSLVSTGRVERVIVKDLSRLNRNLLDMLKTIKVLEKHDVDLISIKEGLSLKGSGKIFIQILGVLGEWEREQCSIRTKDALNHLKENNQKYGQVPYGKKEVNGKLVDDEREIFMLKKIKTLKEKGKSNNEIKDFLGRRNYLKKNGTNFTRIDVVRLVKKMDNYVNL